MCSRGPGVLITGGRRNTGMGTGRAGVAPGVAVVDRGPGAGARHDAPTAARGTDVARASPEASMSCSFCVCFSWLSVGFTCAAPTVFVVHSSTNLCRSSVKVPFLLLLLFTCAWTCRVGWGPGSGPGATQTRGHSLTHMGTGIPRTGSGS